uniref:BHLH domain-containing protein n=1 Tax=Denticeps clupeoides TaxID=299321 RepID=A0AAY4C9N9_9TELE
MTPTVNSAVTYSMEQLTFTNKIRRPLVEKMRRDRINNSIEQLKSLLYPEIHNHLPDSKLEKESRHPGDDSLCNQETVHFLSREEVKTQTHQRPLNQFQNLQPPCDKNRKESVLPQLNCPVQLTVRIEKSPVTSRLWRP